MLQDFINQYKGQTDVGNTVGNTGKCTGLVEVYLSTFNLPHIWGNAKDLLANADPKLYDIIYNDPNDTNQYPSAGDPIVWDDTWGNGDGHTGIVVTADGNSFSAFEQNDVTSDDSNGACEIIKHADYSGVLGWLHIKDQSATTKQQQLDIKQQLIDANNKKDEFYNELQDELHKDSDLRQQIEKLQEIQKGYDQAVYDRDANWNIVIAVKIALGIEEPNPMDKKVYSDNLVNAILDLKKKANTPAKSITTVITQEVPKATITPLTYTPPTTKLPKIVVASTDPYDDIRDAIINFAANILNNMKSR